MLRNQSPWDWGFDSSLDTLYHGNKKMVKSESSEGYLTRDDEVDDVNGAEVLHNGFESLSIHCFRVPLLLLPPCSSSSNELVLMLQ